jgi:hypothetical protein
MASRIKRFGWPYRENAEAVVRQVIAEQERLRPSDQGAVGAAKFWKRRAVDLGAKEDEYEQGRAFMDEVEAARRNRSRVAAAVTRRDYVLKRCPECHGQAESGIATHIGDCPNRYRVWVPEEVLVAWPTPGAVDGDTVMTRNQRGGD